MTFKHLALLRGINVGGNNIIRMAELRFCFEKMGFTDVSTYIQSGNILFTSKEKNPEKHINMIEKVLSKEFSYQSRVVVISSQQLENIVKSAPKGFGQNPKKYRYDVLFLKKPLTSSEAMKSISLKDGVDEVHAGKHVLYFTRLISKATQSHLSKIVQQPIYQFLTIRNWNTTSKLLKKMEMKTSQ